MLYKIALFIYCFILILDMHKAKDIKNILKRGFISIVIMIAMLIATIAQWNMKKNGTLATGAEKKLIDCQNFQRGLVG